MQKDISPIETDQAPGAIGPYSQAIKTGSLLFCSGQIPIDPATGDFLNADAATAAEQVIKNVTAVLAAGGATLADVVKTTVFLVNMDDFAAVNAVYARHFGESKPARACVEVSKLPKGALVEMDAIAVC